MRLPSWLSFWRPASPRASSRGPRSHRPTLEQLEGRSLPAAFTAASVPELIADIKLANSNTEPDSITLVAGQTYSLTAADNVDIANGLPVIAANDNLTIQGKGATIERSTATGTPAFRLFDVAAGASLTLSDLTLQGGLAYGLGGAIYNQGGLSLTRVTVQNNVAQGGWWGATGGGIWSNGALTLEATTIQNNQARGLDGTGGSAFGGGVYIGGGTALLNGVTLSGNTAQGGNGGDGDVYYVRGYSDHFNSRTGYPDYYFATGGGNGGVGYGGGLYAAGGTVTLHNSSVTGNTAKGGAGGHGGTGRGVKGADGSPGAGVGGGLYLNTLTYLDAFTAAHVKGNHASTSDPDIAGGYLPAS
jgi:hypothetical protein